MSFDQWLVNTSQQIMANFIFFTVNLLQQNQLLLRIHQSWNTPPFVYLATRQWIMIKNTCIISRCGCPFWQRRPNLFAQTDVGGRIRYRYCTIIHVNHQTSRLSACGTSKWQTRACYSLPSIRQSAGNRTSKSSRETTHGNFSLLRESLR